MTDRYSQAKRSDIMRRVRSSGTEPERLVAAALKSAGLQFCTQYKVAGIAVDIALVSQRVAVFVDGCLWHGCPRHDKPFPKTNVEFWRGKVRSNRLRDRHNRRTLGLAGWKVVRIWEHTARRSPSRARAAVVRALHHVPHHLPE